MTIMDCIPTLYIILYNICAVIFYVTELMQTVINSYKKSDSNLSNCIMTTE